MSQTFEQYCALKVRNSFDSLPKLDIKRPQLVRFRGKVYTVMERLPNNVMKVTALRGFDKQIVHDYDLDI